MIICSCNVLTNQDVADAVREGACRPREVYAANGCKAQCGNCVAGVMDVMRAMARCNASAVEAMHTCTQRHCNAQRVASERLEVAASGMLSEVSSHQAASAQA